MASVVMLGIDSPERSSAELFIKSAYELQYGAKLDSFPLQLMAQIGEGGKINCAAGVRTERDGFFSEHYLDAPVEELLSTASGQPTRRSEIFEVSTLASCAPKATPGFIREIVTYGRAQGFAWSFFTLTHRLAQLVMHLGLSPIFLAQADRRRVGDFERWGDYYAHQPMVYAVANESLVQRRDLSSKARNAEIV